MRRSPRTILIVLLLLLVPSAAVACLWDYDTLLAERSRFPSVLELITGKFLRHSPEFYEWRIKDRLQKLESEPENLAYLDDLAVAYDKLGKQDEAIALMEKKEQIKPGLYETVANHGTFHAHAGRFAEALPFLKRAIEINPDAHFGREKYQILLIEYSLAQQQLPVTTEHQSFSNYLEAQHDKQLPPEERAAAVKGILGIIRFGNQDNPKVLAALAGLLSFDHDQSPERDAKALAARALLKASYLTSEAAKSAELRKRAEGAVLLQDGVSFATLETEFRGELADADKWYAELRDRELAWIKAGVDVDAEFAKLYRSEPVSLTSRKESNLGHNAMLKRQTARFFSILIGGVVVLFLMLIASIVAMIRLTKWWSGPPALPSATKGG